MPEPLVVVALEEEAAHLDIDLPILITGVGKVNAALAVTRRLASAPRPSMIINLGTAGGLRPGLSGTHEIGSVIQHDFDSVSIEALTGRRYGAAIELAAQGLVLATGDVFVSDPAVRDRLAEDAHLVDMEGYAVAAAAAAFDIPVRMVKHVSDDADHSAIKSWTSTIAESSRALAAWLATS
ncbi:nucleosidase [Rhizocola hellebori]|uniref:Nucleosidase n=1 Tax=Rhizocola hellebori TaxID=1392758 RepID=A0A8J3Q3D1_9ACTN|nr:nucleosidase [Rhizocola hellebori]GIH02732.1 nucleosidase [Rhizocola hellebori]